MASSVGNVADSTGKQDKNKRLTLHIHSCSDDDMFIFNFSGFLYLKIGLFITYYCNIWPLRRNQSVSKKVYNLHSNFECSFKLFLAALVMIKYLLYQL